jgi:hypothetical protein
MNAGRKRHLLAIELLEKLGLTHIRLERKKTGSYDYVAWNTPLVDGNGSPRVVKRGKVRVR